MGKDGCGCYFVVEIGMQLKDWVWRRGGSGKIFINWFPQPVCWSVHSECLLMLEVGMCWGERRLEVIFVIYWDEVIEEKETTAGFLLQSCR